MTRRSAARRFVVCFAVLTLAATYLFAEGGTVHVRGYYRRDGTYVRPHCRTAPDGNPYNNYSFPGNYNPNTGRVATGNPDTYVRRYYARSGSSYGSASGYEATVRTTSPDVDGTRTAAPRGPRRYRSNRTAALQIALRQLGCGPGPVDGLYGPMTKLAVMLYQSRNGLAVDGIAGPATRASLLRDLRLGKTR